jgi:sterol desaturase/sphingolipid hydroxylase (fatty acid hydroxylase superfamily)
MADTHTKPEPSEPGPMSREWHFHPPLPVGYAPYWLWPPNFARLAKWVFENWLQFSDRSLYVLFAIAVAFWQHPFGPDQAELSPGWMLQVLLRNLALLSLVAGVLHFWFYGINAQGTRLKFDPRPMSKKKNALFKFGYQTWDNMYYSLVFGVPVASGYEILNRWLFANGLTPAITFSNHWLWFILAFPFLALFQSLHFYAIHRLIHWPPLYRHVHSVHHRNVNTGPWSGNSMHPVEHLFYFSALLVFLILPSHPVHVLFLLYWLQLGAASSHSGYEAVWVKDKSRLLLGAFFHQLHHRYYECNYGNSEMPWDRWFGSFHDGSEEATQITRDRKRKMHTESVSHSP